MDNRLTLKNASIPYLFPVPRSGVPSLRFTFNYAHQLTPPPSGDGSSGENKAEKIKGAINYNPSLGEEVPGKDDN
ncbi:hypothetical protein [Gloeothece verrucosa]|uniref:Uncharacterized protein n=1 Tax=Gloeothece verrucosa (strain PCC 7822) TaxID=497965 RepID=E0UH59_GLOV7|nr:hypothetical protein [Gloeothece verrucosa]ADN15658.1 hypothetical protein Cyan7822_3722 [Gloeothece verrucosa PCC 7822]